MTDWHKLQHLKPENIQQLQNKLLRNFIKTQVPYHPYYRESFRKNKIKFSGIKTTDDLKKLPFTSKEDIAPTKQNPKRFLDFVLQPNERLMRRHATLNKKIKIILNREHVYHEYKPVHIHFTTGRSALSVPVLYTQYDLARLEESGRRMFEILDISGKDIAVNAFPYAPHLAFWQTFYAAKGAGILSLNTGGGKIMGTERIIKSIESMNATILAGMPGYLYHLIRTAKEEKANFSNLNLIAFGGERIPQGLREKIKDYLSKIGSKARVLSTYAFTEGKVAWVECSEKSGYHLYPDFEFIEVVDKNGERVGEGEKGEIVYTSLGWRGTVFLRYKTGDVAKGIYYERCSHCRRALPRIDAEIERKSEYREFRLTKIKGSFVNLNALFPIMMAHKDIEEWQIEIRKKNNDPYEVDEFVVYVAPKKSTNFAKLKNALKQKIMEETEITPEIVNIGIKELLKRLGMETELKEKRIIDARK